MANIFRVHPPNTTQGVGPVSPTKPKSAAAQASGVSDTVEISTAGMLAAKLHGPAAVRTDLVERVKEQISAGTFETPERIEATVDRLMEELFPNL
ncbi:MAG: flagellar biosynthesis anti-sigma factor FlgM [Phycisphaerae bacterium]|nr:flagellar biosynthesis anti-sigma factor FlgM [Phycisphaerae bacterium]